MNIPHLNYDELEPRSRATMIEARRLFRIAKMVIAKAPFSGPYYWIPLTIGTFVWPCVNVV